MKIKWENSHRKSFINFYFTHDDVIKWKHVPRYWPFVRGIHRSSVYSPHNGQWRGALMFAFICAWTNGWVNNREAGDLKRHRIHYDVTVMQLTIQTGAICSATSNPSNPTPETQFTKRSDVLPSKLLEARSREIRCYNDRITLKFDRLLREAGQIPRKV